jgi:hypothetical protein
LEHHTFLCQHTKPSSFLATSLRTLHCRRPICSHQAAKDVVLANKPVITDDSSQLEPALLKALMEQISSLASVYHKPADTFVSRQRLAVQTVDTLAAARSFAEEDITAAAAAPQVGGGWAWLQLTCWLLLRTAYW